MREEYRFLGDSQPNFQRTAIIKISLPASLFLLPQIIKNNFRNCGIHIYIRILKHSEGIIIQVECTIFINDRYRIVEERTENDAVTINR